MGCEDLSGVDAASENALPSVPGALAIHSRITPSFTYRGLGPECVGQSSRGRWFSSFTFNIQLCADATLQNLEKRALERRLRAVAARAAASTRRPSRGPLRGSTGHRGA